MRTVGMLLLPILFFIVGLYSAPIAVRTYHQLFPEPAFRIGDFNALHSQANSEVVMFSTSTCPYCKEARALLDARNINYKDYVTDVSKEAEGLFEKRGGGAVPLLYIGNREIRGLHKQAIYEALASLKSSVSSKN